MSRHFLTRTPQTAFAFTLLVVLVANFHHKVTIFGDYDVKHEKKLNTEINLNTNYYCINKYDEKKNETDHLSQLYCFI